MTEAGYYIPQAQWIDFFNPDAANAYWKHFSQRLLPTGIDAWCQDATEPENDDLAGRRVSNGKIAGERVRNLYPLLFNRTVYEGRIHDRPQQRAMILT
ncbi:glycoside hydrolase family 31 protein, partial [Enterococcus sp. 2CBP]|nr:glycoside hydrolase family 31 protein [Enterococcus sp. 2CBP]